MTFSKEDKEILIRITKLFKIYRNKILKLLGCMLISTFIAFLTPLITKWLMDDGLLTDNFSNVVKYSLFSLVLVFLGQAIGLAETKFEAYLSIMVPYDLSKAAFKKILRLKMEYLNNTNFAEIMSNISMDIDNICNLLSRQTFFIVMQVFSIIGGVIGLLLIDWKLTLLVIFIIPLRYFIVKYLAKERKHTFEEYMDYVREKSLWYGDAMLGLKEIKLLGIHRIKIGEFIKKHRGLIKSNYKMFFQDKINVSTENISSAIITTAMYILGAYMIFNGSLTVGGLFAFITYSMNVIHPISTIIGIGYHYVNVIPSGKRFFEFMDMECEENELIASKDRISLHDFILKDVEYENVSFAYSNSKINALKNINLKIQQGEKVAIIGMNGSGKTTLINLLLRIYSPSEGKITINNIDIKDIKLSDYRKLISVVSQDFYLFNGTVKDNICIKGKIKETDIINAVSSSGATDFINNLDEGFNSKIGRNGVKLSGGERQKLALARALAIQSQIIILDEVTANIDVESENQINKVIIDKLKDKTVILIAHRSSLLEYMDRVIVLEKGKIKDMGTYDELCNRGSISLFNNEEREAKQIV